MCPSLPQYPLLRERPRLTTQAHEAQHCNCKADRGQHEVHISIPQALLEPSRQGGADRVAQAKHHRVEAIQLGIRALLAEEARVHLVVALSDGAGPDEREADPAEREQAVLQPHLAHAPSSPARQAQQGEDGDEIAVADDRAEAEELLRRRGHGRVEATEQQSLDDGDEEGGHQLGVGAAGQDGDLARERRLVLGQLELLLLLLLSEEGLLFSDPFCLSWLDAFLARHCPGRGLEWFRGQEHAGGLRRRRASLPSSR